MILNKIRNLIFIVTIFLSACSESVYVFGDEIETPKTTTNSVDKSSGKEVTSLVEGVFDDNLKTVLLKPSAWALGSPIIQLRSTEKLLLSFDDFNETDNRRFSYIIVRCTSLWEETNESPQNFLDGFANDIIDQFEFSHNTVVSYKHYQHTIPSNYRFTKSGNYALKVYDMATNALAFVKHFQIVENLCKIEPTVKKASKLDDANYRQEVDFKLTVPSSIVNPHREIEVHLFKNGNRIESSKNLKPIFSENNVLTYDYDEENVFDGGNEFRSINLQSLRFNAEGVARIEKGNREIVVTALEDKARTYAKYFGKDDLNGKFLIKNQDREPSELTAEYLTVNFTLNYPHFLPDGEIYLFGEISNWQINDAYKMNYDFSRKIYTQTLLLKQGFYDYQYVYVRKQNPRIDEAYIEGTHFQTQNEYTIQVYWKNAVMGEDFLIGSYTFQAH
jgi:hypothetical protein